MRYKKCSLLHSTHLRILSLDIMLGIMTGQLGMQDSDLQKSL